MRILPVSLLLAALALAGLAACLSSTSGGDNAHEAPLEYADAGVPDRPDPPPDAGVAVCLPIAPVPDAELPRCTAATKDCVAACPAQNGDACRNSCWSSDPTPPVNNIACSNCVFTQVLSCFDANGCHESVADFMCCLASACAGGAPNCDQQCSTKANSMFTCGFVNAPQCGDLVGGEVGKCYATSDPDAGPASSPDGGA